MSRSAQFAHIALPRSAKRFFRESYKHVAPPEQTRYSYRNEIVGSTFVARRPGR